ncbi:MAG: hypothetical protein D6692_14155 [Planctomycetota bacterium]|nr:MAG: hypothetical protein D6692_14155 [Planctomycetota bacterium]
MPPLPSWEGLHPIVVHFPIALFLAAIVPAALAMVFRKRAGTWLWASVLMIAMATAGAFLAVATGEAAEDIVGPTSQAVEQAIHEHEEAGEMVRNLFLVTLGLAVVLAALASREKRDLRLIGPAAVVMLGSWVFASIRLADAAHQGGVLVHVHGIHAPLGTGGVPISSPAGRHTGEDDD